MNIRLVTGAAVLAVALSACAPMVWNPPPGKGAAEFNVDSAGCKMMARGMTPSGGGFYAQGSPRFVATAMGGYALGSAIGSAIAVRENYKDCMEMNGYTLAN